uniref:uncharacterized protein LOC120336913 n=1 Tax=Styela clava TaxID=7725 RepID=UPI00193ACD8E|nr:uncharacterized protein LOC120336913 [Styela clava]
MLKFLFVMIVCKAYSCTSLRAPSILSIDADGNSYFNVINNWHGSSSFLADRTTHPELIGSYVFNLGFVNDASLTFNDDLSNQIKGAQVNRDAGIRAMQLQHNFDWDNFFDSRS